MSYDQMTLLELKTICKDRGLKVSGTKNEVIIRLMEYDEASSEAEPTTFGTTVGNMPGLMPISPQIVYGKINSQGIVIGASNNSTSTVGTVIILYGIFRMFWALGFAAFGDGNLGWLLAPVAFIVACSFIFSGILLTQGYRNGIYTTIVTFIVSGSLSIIFSGQTLNPVSVSLSDGGMMIPFSMMCTLLGIFVAAIPLLLTDDELKEGWPPFIERLLNKGNTEKKQINCTHCGHPLLVPKDYSGRISCPQCGKQSTV